MYFTPRERVAVFIDGSELRATMTGMDIDVDFKKLRDYFQQSCQLVRAVFYFIERDADDASLHPLSDWLDYNGYTTVACSGLDDGGDQTVRRRNKNFLNVRLTVDALEISPAVDHIVIFSGDSVLGPLVDALKWRGRRVSIISTLLLKPPMVADDLRRRADQFIDLADIAPALARPAPNTTQPIRLKSRAKATSDTQRTVGASSVG